MPFMKTLASHFTVIAPDTPGYGLSDQVALDEPCPPIDIFADAIADFMDTIGIEKAGVYGFHTGSAIGLKLAIRHPEKVSCLVINGSSLLNEAEREDFLANYLVPFRPSWDGSHLSWLWARLREQQMFFPWHQRTVANRMDHDMPSPDKLHQDLLHWLRAGDNYRIAYGAAFAYDKVRDIPSVQVPMTFLCGQQDPLSKYLQRLPDLPKHISTEIMNTQSDALDRATNVFKRHLGGPAIAAAEVPKPIRGRTWGHFAYLDEGEIRLRMNDEAEGRPVFVLHDAAGSSALVDPVTRSLVGRRPVYAPDFPGNGDSDSLIGEDNVTVSEYARMLGRIIDSLGIEEVDLYGMWGGGLVALELSIQRPALVRNVIMSNVIHHDSQESERLQENYTPDFQPDWYGGYLLRAWHYMRDQGLFWPWFDKSRQGIIWREPFIDTEMIHQRVVDLLKAGSMYAHAYRAHFSYRTGDKLKETQVPTYIWTVSWDPNFEHTKSAAAEAGVPLHILPDDWSKWGPALLEKLSN